MRGILRPVIEYTSTLGVVVFSLSNFNALLTTIVLLLTIIYWVQKNLGIRRENNKK